MTSLPLKNEATAKQEPVQNPNVPATPKRDTQPKLMRTPGSHNGTSARAVSDANHDHHVKDLHPGVKQDLLSHEQCEFDDMLKVLLRKALNDTTDSNAERNDTALLEDALKAMLPTCVKIEGDIRTYCTTKVKGETDRYGMFVKTFNKALDNLHKLRVTSQGSKFKTPEQNLMLCRNAEHAVEGRHNGIPTKTKPDVVLTTREAAYRCLQAKSYTDLQKRSSKQPEPNQNFEWSDMLSVFEFKLILDDLSGLVKALIYDDIKLTKRYPPFEDIEAMSPPGQRRATAASQPIKRKSESENDSGRKTKRQQTAAPTAAAIEKEHKRQQSDKQSDRKAELSRQVPREDEKSADRPPPMVQTAMYGAEMLCGSIAVTHAINVVFFDDVMYVWWYDREGAIQCSGISFVQDLPRFLAFLFAFQRLPLTTWRVADELDPLINIRLTTQTVYTYGPSKRIQIGKATIELDAGPESVIHEAHCLVGRATRVLKVKGSWTNESQQLQKADNLILKIYWPDSSRESEADLVKRAIERGDDFVKKRMPRIIASQDFTSYDTKHIRNLLGLKARMRAICKEDGTREEADIVGSRILRVIVSEELFPITHLRGELFLDTFFQIQLCHYKVWKIGIHHNDPSLSNFMYYKEGEVTLGVPNDWDLAIDIHSNPQHHGLERTGTVPYMALDLLQYGEGQIRHLYRHDHEATIWIVTWVFLCYKNGKYVGNSHNPRLGRWRTGNYIDCSEAKKAFLLTLAQQEAQEEWKFDWKFVLSLLRDLRNGVLSRDDQREQPHQPVTEEDDPDGVLRAQWATIERTVTAFPEDLGYVLRYKPDFSLKKSASDNISA